MSFFYSMWVPLIGSGPALYIVGNLLGEVTSRCRNGVGSIHCGCSYTAAPPLPMDLPDLVSIVVTEIF